MKTDSKLIFAKISDLFELCSKRGRAMFSDFLSGGEAALIEDEFHMPYGYNAMFFGGYDGAERKMLGVFPEWLEAEEKDFPMRVVRFDAPKFRSLTHRDYLGTLMSLGIDRRKTGDILTDENGAYAVLSADIAEYVARSIGKIANAGVKTGIMGFEEFDPPKPHTIEQMKVCASLRLDAVAAAAFNLSRADVDKLISGGGVKVNHREVFDRSKRILEGDLLSVKGKGRFILKETGNNTAKGRLHITVEKFV